METVFFDDAMQEKMFALLLEIPKGKVVTYQSLAEKLGNKNLSRAVGKWLSLNTDLEKFPCYKVVKKDGTLGGYAGGVDVKQKKLEEDGVVFRNGKVEKESFYKYSKILIS